MNHADSNIPEMHGVSLFVVIPVFNGWESTRRCLDALEQTPEKPNIIVVDHGSTDETKTELPELFPRVRIVLGDESLWWSGATNLGIRAALSAGATVVMLLNNDCYLERDTVGALLLHHARYPDAVIAPRQRDTAGRDIGIERTSTCLLLGFSSLMLPAVLSPVADPEGLFHVHMIAGGRGTLIPAGIFKRVGLLDEACLPHYFADHDFYLQCRKKKVPLRVAANAWVTIDGRRTSLAASGIPESMTELRQLLGQRRSHRNLEAHTALFKKHYPIPALYGLGIGFYLLRYMLLFGAKKLGLMLRAICSFQSPHRRA